MNKTTSVVIAVIVGVIIAGAGLLVIKSNKTANNGTTGIAADKQMMMTDTKAADLRVLLNALDREHVDLALNATRNGYSGSPDFAASAAELDTNTVALGDAIGSVYGDDAKNKFLEIWRSHIGFFVDYTVASKKGDKVGMDKAVKNLGGYQNAIADFLSSANPNLPRQAVFDLIGEHIVLLKTSVDSYAGADYASAYSTQHKANEQVGTIADALAGAIVKQNPDKFK